MTSKPIRNAAEHERALAELITCLENEPVSGSQQYKDAEVLATRIEHYEGTHFPIEPPSDVEAANFRIDQLKNSTD